MHISRTVHLLVVSTVMAAAAFMLSMALAGCAESAPDKCLRYGFTPHTDGFSNCMLQLENRQMREQFNIGDVVAYSATFVKRYPASAARRRGIIADFEGNRDWDIAVVEWRDGTLSRVNVRNLAKPGANAHFCPN